MEFDYCCNKPNMYEYSIIHDGRFDTRKNEIFLKILWQLPDTDSRQSDQNTVFMNSAYDDFFIDILKTQLELGISDYLFSEDTENVNSIAEHYKYEMCLDCSKLVIKTGSSTTKIVDFFRHVRNAVAHGSFNIIGDKFIGFDSSRGKYTAVIKVKYDNLKKLVSFFAESTEIVDIYEKSLKRLGYHVTLNDEDSLYVKKGKHVYMLFIRHYTGRYANTKDIGDFVHEFNYIDKTNCMFVLVIDSTYATKNIQSFLTEQNISIIDKSSLKKMMQGADVLKNLLELRKIQ